MPPISLRPRSTTEIIDAAVQLLRQHYKELVTTTAIFIIPVILLRAIFPMPVVVPGQMPQFGGGIIGTFVQVIAAIVLGSMSTAAVVVIVSDSYLGREVTIGAAINRVLERFGTVLGATILQTLIIIGGFILFIIPGLIFIAWYFATINVVMVEGRGTFAALGRSKSLTAGSVGKILGTLILAGLAILLVQFVVGLILALVIPALRTNSNISAIESSIVSIFIYPLVTVVVTLLYYDLRIRKEGFDLEIMAKELGFATPTPVPAKL